MKKLSVEEVVRNILSHCHSLTHKEVTRAIEDKKDASAGLLTDEAAARLVAAELGVEITHETALPEICISQLVSGLNDVTVSGHVRFVGLPRTFYRSKGSGQVARLLIADETGTINVVLWDDKADLTRKMQLGQLVKVLHGYLRMNKRGNVELHVGQRGDIQTVPSDKVGSQISQVRTHSVRESTHITDLEEGMNVDLIEGLIASKPMLKEVTVGTGEKMVVAIFELKDETGKIRVSAWRSHTKKVEGLIVGAKVWLKHVYVQKGFGDQLEIAIRASTMIEVQQQAENHTNSL